MGWIKRRINKEESKHNGRLDWGLCAEKKLIATIMDWCYKNNTIKIGNMALASLDGGHVNVLKLKAFLEGQRQSGFAKEQLNEGESK